MSWPRVEAGPSFAARSYPTPETMSTFSTKTVFALVRDPVARDMGDRVARGAAHAEQLGRRFRVGADAGEVLVAEAVDLARGHDDVAVAVPEVVEDRAEGEPGFDDRGFGGARDGARVVDDGADAVGHQKIGLEGQLREPRADGRGRAEAARQDLAVAAKRLGRRHRADLPARRPSGVGSGFGESCLRHRLRTAFWYSASFSRSR